jgi:hypothetical protein
VLKNPNFIRTFTLSKSASSPNAKPENVTRESEIVALAGENLL